MATRYMEQCSGLWVVAPITRAVDDKAAQTLMGKSFRRQLQLDGMYSNVTVICSKTDQITVSEVMNVMPEGEGAHHFEGQLKLLQAEKTKLHEESKRTSECHSEVCETIEKLEEEFDRLDNVIGGAANEDKVPISSPLKRMVLETDPAPRKRVRCENNSDAGEADADGSDETVSSDRGANEEYISIKDAIRLREIVKQKKKDLRTKRSELDKERKRIRNDIEICEASMKEAESEKKSACIKYRNNYSRSTIPRQFAEGLKESVLIVLLYAGWNT